MSERCKQNPVVMAAFENLYGTQNKYITVKLADNLEFNDVKSELEIDRKTGQITQQSMQTNKGYEYVDATLTGTLTKAAFDMILQAMTNDSESPFVHSNSCTRQGLSLYRYFDEGTIGTTTDDYYDVVVGCICTQASLTMGSGANITYSATFRGKSLDRETQNTGDDALTLTAVTDASHPNDDIASFGDITASLGGAAAITSFNSATLTLTNELCADELLFQNSNTMQNPIIQTAGGSLTATWIYDTDDDPTINGNIQGTLQADTITILIGTAHQYAIETYGKIESYENPSEGRCKMTGSFNKKLMGDYPNSVDMLTVTYTDIS